MATLAEAPDSGRMDQKQFLSELTNIQKSLFEQASNHTKLVLGIGYAGFFGAWAGTKANLRPIEIVGSAFLICLSLTAYIAFEIVQARFASIAVFDLSETLSKPVLEATVLQEYQ